MVGKKRAHLSLSFLFGLAMPAHSAVILQYHHVSETLPPVTSISKETFKQHLAFLKNNGFNVIGLDKLFASLQQGHSLPDKTVAITFDDGYDNNFDTAAPILKEYGFPYTIFVNPQLIDEHKSYVMTWEQLRKLSKEGAIIASHSSQHDYLHEKRPSENDEQWRVRIRADLTNAQNRIAEEIGHNYPWVAFPYGEYNKALQRLLNDMAVIGIGQQSGAVDTTTDWTAVPRYPASGIYANIDTLKYKLTSAAFPLKSVDYEDTVTDNKEPVLTLNFKDKPFHQSQFACYVSGQGQAKTEWLSETEVKVYTPTPLSKGRSRYNCTSPMKDNSARYYWYSQQWLVQ
ncbi:polysaccharide deacetylase family protein [Pseudoalteromonas xiamenensis]|uniref:polysaccharide deacetylase family protein n=1 Tax=Pseudoalteromonas xiamenensis TaxID=882626 RepID=UPI0027E3E7CB|nr:polysaccharide deacetylase family protein [Pseudoalteromonas xiamenensis]WMN58746.1 polysaccharide deacetylase family protein [Pseudoalteromonas xiamenensis]